MISYKPKDCDELKKYIDNYILIHGYNCDLNHIDVSDITNMFELFKSSQFNGDLSKWDTSKVRDMNNMFAYSSFNGDISQWNIENVQNMNFMFSGSQFNRDLSRWNTKSVEYMVGMFQYSQFNRDISNWNISKTKNMAAIFKKSKFNGNISQWNISETCFLKECFNYFHFSPVGILGLINNEYVLSDEVEWASQFHEYKTLVKGFGLEGLSAAQELYLLLKKDLDKNVIIEITHNDFNM